MRSSRCEKCMKRFTLRTMISGALLTGSAMLLWAHWNPWFVELTLSGFDADIIPGAVKFSDDARRLAICSSHSVEIWDAVSGQRLVKFQNSNAPYNVNFSNDGLSAGTVHAGGIIRTWDVKNGNQLLELKAADEITDLEPLFTPSGRWIVFAEEGFL